jgi:putative transposase
MTTRSSNTSPRNRTKGINPKGPLSEASKDRGKKVYNLWYLFSPKCRSDVVLKGDAEICNLWMMELDPRVATYKIGEPTGIATLQEGARATIFDADIQLRGGVRELREVKPYDDLPLRSDDLRAHLQKEAQEQIAASLNATYRRVGPTDFRREAALIGSAKIAVASLSAVRLHSIEPQHASLMAFMCNRSRWSAEELLGQVEWAERALLEAAVFRAIARGELLSDVAENRWGRRTQIWLPGTQPSTASGQDEHELGNRPIDGAQQALAMAQANVVASRALRTANVQASLETSIHRAELESDGGWFTRKNFPKEYQELDKWPMVLVPDEDRPRFDRLRSALTGYLGGAKIARLEAEHGINRSEILRILNRAVAVHADGQIWGWRACLNGAHVGGYVRRAPVMEASPGSALGFAGALQQLFALYPQIQTALDRTIQKRNKGQAQEACMNAPAAHRTFLSLCVEAGISIHDYPFNCASQGLKAIQNYVKTLRGSDFQHSAYLLGGHGAGKRAKLDNGFDPLLVHRMLYDAVQQDTHRLDFVGSISVPHPSGSIRIPIQRMSLDVVVEQSSLAVLGYSVTIGTRISAQDALASVQHALSRWEPMQIDQPVISYPEGAGFPSGLIPGLAGAAWATHYLDNDTVYTSKLVAERIRVRVGCAVNFGPVGDWTRRHIIEGVFSVLTKRGFQRLPNTTGAHPKDPRRRDAEKQAVDLMCDYKEFLYLIDVALAIYNATGLSTLGMRSPLQFLRDQTQDDRSNFMPRYLPPLPHCMPEMDVAVETRRIRGSVKEGRRPYVEIDEVHYTSAILANCGSLIGALLTVQIKESDMRTVQAFLATGEQLGPLMASSGWNEVAHDRKTRRLINKLRREFSLHLQPEEDWVTAYLRYLSTKGSRQAVRTPNKASSDATRAANLANRTGLQIPDVPAPDDLPTLPIPVSPARSVRLPPFVPRVKRRALY